MASSQSGSFTAFLLLIPVLTVPMLAIFGPPDLAPLAGVPAEAGDTTDEEFAEMFGEPTSELAARDSTRGLRERPAIDARPEGLVRPAIATDADAAPVRFASAEEMTPIPGRLTWKDAVDRLNELDIHNYRLEPGSRLGEFVFGCTYTHPSQPQLTYRFEDEANDPLEAVSRVLQQVDEWRRQSPETMVDR